VAIVPEILSAREMQPDLNPDIFPGFYYISGKLETKNRSTTYVH
jgi:hypothetical protein